MTLNGCQEEASTPGAYILRSLLWQQLGALVNLIRCGTQVQGISRSQHGVEQRLIDLILLFSAPSFHASHVREERIGSKLLLVMPLPEHSLE